MSSSARARGAHRAPWRGSTLDRFLERGSGRRRTGRATERRLTMSLRAKLLATYLMFVAALAALGLWSAWRLEQAGAVSQRILSESYESVVAAQSMKESLERLDSATLFAELGRTDRAHRQIEEHGRRFDAAFARAAGNITEPGEREIIDAIRRERDECEGASSQWGRRLLERVEPTFDAGARRCQSPAAAQSGRYASKIRRDPACDGSFHHDDGVPVGRAGDSRAWDSPCRFPPKSTRTPMG